MPPRIGKGMRERCDGRMWTAATVAELREQRQALAGRVALVPTMGALHEGHLALIDAGRQLADQVIVSIFVNPTQFGPGEDFQKYPRPVEADLAACRARDVDGVFMPDVQQMYPPGGIDTRIDVPLLTGEFEAEHRRGHFAGVCRVVTKLLNMAQPDVAVFGRKDYQQWRIIEAMTADMGMPVRIVGVDTVRDSHGLALSSRNTYLSPKARKHALGLYKALCEARMLVEDAAEADPLAVEKAMRQVMQAHQVEVDYAAVRHPMTLAKLDAIEPQLTGGVVALVAGRIEGVRLLDNMLLATTDAP